MKFISMNWNQNQNITENSNADLTRIPSSLEAKIPVVMS